MLCKVFKRRFVFCVCVCVDVMKRFVVQFFARRGDEMFGIITVIIKFF
jgi:hypothetical protein